MIYLDTHIVVWLFSSLTEKISSEAQLLITQNEIRVSPMVRLELSFLKEIGRINYSSDEIMDDLGQTLDLIECPKSFASVIRQANKLTWTRDPFDRIIVAQAMLNESQFVTKDSRIIQNYTHAIG